MERYFEFKYYEEIVGYIIGAVILIGAIAIPLICTAFDAFKKWWKGE